MSDEACVTTTASSRGRESERGGERAKGATGRRLADITLVNGYSNCVDAAKRCDAMWMRCGDRRRQPHNNNNCRLTRQMEREGGRVGDWWRINNARRDANLAKWLVGHEATGSKATATAIYQWQQQHGQRRRQRHRQRQRQRELIAVHAKNIVNQLIDSLLFVKQS